MTDDTQSADIIQRLDWMNLRFAAESQSDATTRRNQTIVDARQEILRLRQPTQTDALADELAAIIKKSKIPSDDVQLLTSTLSNGKRYIIQTETTYSRALQSVL
jgi:phosphoserine phosphatase